MQSSVRHMRVNRIRAATIVLLLVCAGCVGKPENEVVIYSAADREYAKPILAGFQGKHDNVEVRPVFDVESTKTIGLVSKLEAEADRTRCDVFWNNEIMHTLRLEEEGLLQPIRWAISSTWPEEMRAADGSWLGIAARARILIVNRELMPNQEEWPNSVNDLIAEKWKGKCAVASPLFGTTATHFALLDTTLGKEKAAEYFTKIKENAVVFSGNKQVAQAVSSGQCLFGLTDTDDALIEIDSGLPVEIVFPDQGVGQSGAIRIPNTVAVMKNAPHPKSATLLANYLVSEGIEGRLAMGASGQFPIRPGHKQMSRALKGRQPRWMKADFKAAAQRWPSLAKELRALFRGN